jgi:hypothetical protein
MDISQKTAALATTVVAPDTTVVAPLDSIRQRIDVHLSGLHSLISQLRNHTNLIHGPEPESAPSDETKRSEPSALLEAIYQAFEDLDRVFDALEHQVARATKLA